ncbi:MAG TPA: DUF5660 family protein [Candidatus Limnocylindrales bacterium]|nr:DUF5660 family protein [Candidatus Limnocylindrales bacterium]
MASKFKKLTGIKNPLESLSDFTGIGHATAKSAKDDILKGSANDFMEMLGLGLESTDKKGSKHSEPTDIVDFTKSKDSQKSKPESRIEAAIDYHRDIVRSSENISRTELQTMNSKVQQIKMELQALVASSKDLQMTFASVTVEQTTTNIGTYHENFFDWMINMIRDARKKVEDSGSWMNAAKGKGNKKGYWGMFKKHGTSFGLSNERSVATQVG